MSTNDCHNASDTSSILTVKQALHHIYTQMQPLFATETIPLKSCLGRILGCDICAPIAVPTYRNSAMDGYAFHSRDAVPGGTTRLNVIGTSWAGKPHHKRVGSGQCVRIFTGAVLPEGTDSIIIQENVTRKKDMIEFPPIKINGDFVRQPGGEIESGQIILLKGKRLSPSDIGIMATLGIAEVTVMQKPRIAFFSTGNELRPLHDQLAHGEIYDSNRYTLFAMLQCLGVRILDLGGVADDKSQLIETLSNAAESNHAIITSGGVSVGDADLVRSALEKVGNIQFWKIAMKPGKPLAFGKINNAYFFGLPGNPVSVIVTFYLIVRPALLQLMGTTLKTPLRLSAHCTANIKKIPGRQEFQRGQLNTDREGRLTVEPASKQQSHNLSGLVKSNCFIILDAECDGVKIGETVNVEPIDPPFCFN